MKNITAHFQLTYPSSKFENNRFQLDVDLQLPSEGVSVLFGHSGSGKTSLLRCIAGLERAQTGKLIVEDETWQSDTQFIPTHKRPIGYVFQEASLFRHLSVHGNLNYALKRAPKNHRPIDFDFAVQLLGIESLLNRHPHQLSGGERQRAAIARALLIQPRLLLMDEPLAALDLPRKLEILPYLERLKQEMNLPIIYVSHATDEVARLADYLVAMKQGRVIASGTLSETLSHLDSPLKLGEETGVVLNAQIVERDTQWQLARVEFSGGDVWIRDSGHPLHSKVRIRILARDISLAKEQHHDTSIVNSLPATVEGMTEENHPGLTLVRLKVTKTCRETSSYLIARVTRRSAHSLKLAPGQPIWVQIKSVAVI